MKKSVLSAIGTSTLFFVTALSSSALGKEVSSKDVKLLNETFNYTLQCEREIDSATPGYTCSYSDLKNKARDLAAKAGGEFLSYKIVSAPSSFRLGSETQNNRTSDIRVQVKYLR